MQPNQVVVYAELQIKVFHKAPNIFLSIAKLQTNQKGVQIDVGSGCTFDIFRY